jgi:hypothetical protein
MSVQLAVERAAGKSVKRLASVPVLETQRGEVLWKGVVEVFLISSPPPDRAYGWMVDGESEPQYVAMLGMPPINSPADAVRAWLAAEKKKKTQ